MATARSPTSTMKASFACHYRLSKAAGCPSVVVSLVPKRLTSLSRRLCRTTSPPSELPRQNLQDPRNQIPPQSPIQRLPRPSIRSLSPAHPSLYLRPPSNQRLMLLVPPLLLPRLHPIRGVELKTPTIQRKRTIARALKVRGRRLGAPSTTTLQSQRLNNQNYQLLTYHHGRAAVP